MAKLRHHSTHVDYKQTKKTTFGRNQNRTFHANVPAEKTNVKKVEHNDGRVKIRLKSVIPNLEKTQKILWLFREGKSEIDTEIETEENRNIRKGHFNRKLIQFPLKFGAEM